MTDVLFNPRQKHAPLWKGAIFMFTFKKKKEKQYSNEWWIQQQEEIIEIVEEQQKAIARLQGLVCELRKIVEKNEEEA